MHAAMLKMACQSRFDLKQPGEFRVPEGDMGGVGVSPGIDAHSQGCQRQVDALGF